MSYDILFQRALSLHQAGQFDDAEQLYRQILETAPDQPDVLNLLGLIAQAKDLHLQAAELFYRAVRNAPEHAPFYFNLGISLKALNKPHEAMEAFQKVLQLQPDLKEAENERGSVLMMLHEPEKAREAYRRALQQDENYASAHLNLALSYLPDNPQKVRDSLENLSRRFPDEAAVWFELARQYYEVGRDGEAWQAAVKAKELAPASDEAKALLGLLCLKEHQDDKAAIYFEKALLLNPKNTQAMVNLANIRSNVGSFDQAEALYKRVLELEPRNFDACFNYAHMLYRAKRLPEALEIYRSAVILNPKSAEVSNNLGIIMKDQQDYEEALGLFFNAMALDPDLEAAMVNAAETLVLYFEGGHEKEAVQIAENWKRQMPDNPFACHVCCALKGENCEDNLEYSQRLFDNFADHYEPVMQNLDYNLPGTLAAIIGDAEAAIVDLGCGSGLLGEALKEKGKELVGVDLSAKMLALAEKKKTYKKLVLSDAVSFMKSRPKADLVVMADVFGYIGDLGELFTLLKGYKVLFSVEALQDSDQNFVLNAGGRYQHSEKYIRNLLENNGFRDIIIQKAVFRKEKGKDVPGLIVSGE